MTTKIDTDREIRIAERMEARRRPVRVMGNAPDLDDDDPGEKKNQGSSNFDVIPGMSNDFDGFWKRSEFLKCKQGVKMLSDARGLPPGYATGPTWCMS